MKKIIISIIFTFLFVPLAFGKTITINPDELGKTVTETTYKIATVVCNTLGGIVKWTLKGLAVPFYWLEKVKK